MHKSHNNLLQKMLPHVGICYIKVTLSVKFRIMLTNTYMGNIILNLTLSVKFRIGFCMLFYNAIEH